MSVEEFTYLRGRTTRPVKVTLVSAQQAAAYYDPDKSRGAYATRDAYLADLVDFTRREIQELRRLGCEYIQIDAPQYAALLDESIREGYRQRGSDPDQLLDACIELDNAIIDGHAGVTFGIHICRGNYQSMFYASGGYDRIAEQVFRRARFDRFLLEYDDARSGTFEPLRHVPDDRIVVLGLVSSKKPRLETARRARRAHRRGGARRAARPPRAQPAVRVRLDRGGQSRVGRRPAEKARSGRRDRAPRVATMTVPFSIDVERLAAVDSHVHLHAVESSAVDDAAEKYFGKSGAERERRGPGRVLPLAANGVRRVFSRRAAHGPCAGLERRRPRVRRSEPGHRHSLCEHRPGPRRREACGKPAAWSRPGRSAA